MSRQLVEQFATFFFAINDLPAIVDGTEDASYEVWKQAMVLLTPRERVHPMRNFKEPGDGYDLTYQRWELCDQLADVEERDGLAGWPVSFHSTKAFDLETLTAMRDLCQSCFQEAAAAAGSTSRFAWAITQTLYQESVTETIADM